MRVLLSYIQILLSVLLIAAILLQQRGASAGSAFGGDASTYSSRRGLEKILFTATIILAILFFASATAALIVR